MENYSVILKLFNSVMCLELYEMKVRILPVPRKIIKWLLNIKRLLRQRIMKGNSGRDERKGFFLLCTKMFDNARYEHPARYCSVNLTICVHIENNRNARRFIKAKTEYFRLIISA